MTVRGYFVRLSRSTMWVLAIGLVSNIFPHWTILPPALERSNGKHHFPSHSIIVKPTLPPAQYLLFGISEQCVCAGDWTSGPPACRVNAALNTVPSALTVSGKIASSLLNALNELQHVLLCSGFGDRHSFVDARGLQADCHRLKYQARLPGRAGHCVLIWKGYGRPFISEEQGA